MNTIELLESAASAAAPPPEYWTGYAARLRERLEEVHCAGGLQPTVSRSRRRAEARLHTAAISAAIVLAVFGTLLYLGPGKSEPVVVARTEKLPPRPFLGPRPPFAAPHLPSRGARPAQNRTPERRTPPPDRKPSPPDGPFLPPVRVVTISPAAIEAAQPEPESALSGEGRSVVTAPLSLRLTDYRLLRNGIEIARGESIETPPDGVLWFADRKGERFIVSPGEERGSQPATARGKSIAFTWRHDQFEWVSSTPIVETETRLWVSHDRLAPELELPRLPVPAWRLPRVSGPGRLGVERERPLDVKDATEDGGQHVRVGVAKSVLDVLRNKRLR